MGMNTFLRISLFALFVAFCARSYAAEEDEQELEATETNAPLAKAESSKAPSPALTAFVLGAGTGALILSGVEWSDDANDIQSSAAPTQSRPADGATINGGVITFTWKTFADAATYLIDIDHCEAPDVCADLRLEQTPETTYTLSWPAEYPAGRWRIRAVDADNIAGPWSPFRNFTIEAATE